MWLLYKVPASVVAHTPLITLDFPSFSRMLHSYQRKEPSSLYWNSFPSLPPSVGA